MHEESKQSQWTAHLQAHAETGQPIRSWCALNGVTEASFHYCRKRLKPASSPATQLIALPFAASHGEPMMELETPQGYVIRLSSQTHGFCRISEPRPANQVDCGARTQDESIC